MLHIYAYTPVIIEKQIGEHNIPRSSAPPQRSEQAGGDGDTMCKHQYFPRFPGTHCRACVQSDLRDTRMLYMDSTI